MKNYYQQLNITSKATPDEIKQAATTLTQQLYYEYEALTQADKNARRDETQEKADAIKEAYYVLIDEEKRKLHDKALTKESWLGVLFLIAFLFIIGFYIVDIFKPSHTPIPPSIESNVGKTRGGYIACITEKYLEDIITFSVEKSTDNIRLYLLAGNCLTLEGNKEVTRVETSGILAPKIRISYNGTLLWTTREAVNFK